jgi:HK97 family phage major capsid protein
MTDIAAAPRGYEIKAALEPLAAEINTDELSENTDLQAKMTAQENELVELKGTVEKLSRSLNRTPLSAAETGMTRKTSQFVENYVRRGSDAGLEKKSINFTTPADGGFALPKEIDARVEAKLRDISPIRALATVVQTGSADFRKLVATTGINAGWVGETALRPETATNSFAEIAVPTGELYANPAATQAMLDDASFDVEQWLVDEIATEFAAREGSAFISGTGTARPKGFLTYPTANTADAVRAFGTLQHLATGTAGNFPAASPADRLIDLVHALRPAYRAGAAFVMNSKTLSVVRKFKDTQGQFLWQPSVQADRPATLLGYAVVEAEDMPDIATDSLSLAFGNFARGYVVADRTGVRILRDPFSNKPFVHFYATKRTGGAVFNSEAIKLMKFGVA